MSIGLGDYLREVEGVVKFSVDGENMKLLSIEVLTALLTSLNEVRFDEIFSENSKFRTFKKRLLSTYQEHETDFDLADKVYPYLLLCALFPIARQHFSVPHSLEDSVTTLVNCFSLIRGTTHYGLDLLRRTRMDAIFMVLELSISWTVEFCKELVKQTVIKHGRDDVQDKIEDIHHPFFEYILAEVYEKTLPIKVSEGMFSRNVERCMNWRELFEKFKMTSSTKDLISISLKVRCIHCKNKSKCKDNMDKHFVVLGSCAHIFCVEFFKDYVKKYCQNGSECPLCDARFQAWGTSEEFERFRLSLSSISENQAQDPNLPNQGVVEDSFGVVGPYPESPSKKLRIHPPLEILYQSSAGASNAPQSSDSSCPSFSGCQPLCCRPSLRPGWSTFDHDYPDEVKAIDNTVRNKLKINSWFKLWKICANKAFTSPIIKSFVTLTVCDVMSDRNLPSNCRIYTKFLLQLGKVHVRSLENMFSLIKE